MYTKPYQTKPNQTASDWSVQEKKHQCFNHTLLWKKSMDQIQHKFVQVQGLKHHVAEIGAGKNPIHSSQHFCHETITDISITGQAPKLWCFSTDSLRYGTRGATRWFVLPKPDSGPSHPTTEDTGYLTRHLCPKRPRLATLSATFSLSWISSKLPRYCWFYPLPLPHRKKF